MLDNFKVEKVFEEGDTNSVYLTEEETVVKKFSRLSLVAVTISTAFTFLGFPRFFTRRNRVSSVERIREYSFDSLKFPEILSREGEKIREYRYVEGESLKQKALTSEEAAEQVGRELAEIVDEVWERNVYLTDYFLENFIQAEEGLYYVDAEYTGFTGGWQPRFMDKVSAVHTLMFLPPNRFENAYNSFRESFPGKISFKALFFCSIVSLLYAVSLGSWSEFVNVWNNVRRL
ncbi:MAG: hypothetical protein ABEJ93_04815 [Candidatus Nanohalobium sp.]